MGFLDSGFSYQPTDFSNFSLGAPSLTPSIAPSPLYARMFDRFTNADPNSVYQPDDDAKRRLFKQGLLQFAAAVSRPNGGNFAQSLSSGLLAARNGMDDGAQQYANDAYRSDIMKRTQAEMEANTAKTTAYSHLYDANGNINPAGVAEVQKADPMGYLSIHDRLYPEQSNHWQPKEVTFNGANGTVLWNEKTGEMRTLDGQPFGPQAASQAVPPSYAVPSLADAVQKVESNGNPFAVSPKGALGPMQTMPGTLASPGFGVQPARDNSPQEQARVGRDYLGALTQKYGVQGGLAAYNWGPGNWDKALAASGGDPAKALAMAPAETQAYVPKVLGAMGGVNSGIPTQTASGSIPANLPFGFAPKKPDKLSPVDQRKQDVADMIAAGVNVTPAMRNQYLMTGKMPGEDGGATASDPTAGLDPATATLVKKIANYDALPASLGRAQNRADLIGRAAMINPDYNEADAQAAYKFKKDLAASSPTSAGGQVAAGNTLLHHVATLLKANDALNKAGVDGANPFANKLSGALVSQQGQSAVNNWNQAVQFVTQEASKLVKGGVATEGEVHDLVATLDPSLSPTARNDAIKQLAEFARARIATQETRRDQLLGQMAASTPILTPESSRIYDAVQKLNMPSNGGGSGAPAASGKTIVKTGTYGGRKVVQYSDGSVSYAN